MSNGLIVLSQLALEKDADDCFAQIRRRFPEARIQAAAGSEGALDESVLAAARTYGIHIAPADSPRFQLTPALRQTYDWVLLLEANERISAEPHPAEWPTGLQSCEIEARGGRLALRWEEPRLWVAASPGTAVNAKKRAPALTLHKPLFAADRQAELSYEAARLSAEADEAALRFKRAAHEFGAYRYEEALQTVSGLRGTGYEAPSVLLSVLCLHNLGRLQQAVDLLFELLEAEPDSPAAREAAYLYAKLACHVDVPEFREQAIELLDQYADDLSRMQVVTVSDADWLFLKGELLRLTGRPEEAVQQMKYALESSGYTYTKAAYRLTDWLNEHNDQTETNVANLMSLFNIDDASAKRMLYLMFDYLQLDHWKSLFMRYHESAQWASAEEAGTVSVILPVYNDTAYLHEAVRSLLHQTYANFELIVVDDGSDVPLESFLQRFWFDRRIRLVRLSSNRGLPQALNEGMRMATGRYTTWISADNQLHPRWLERMVTALEHQTGHVGVYSDYYHMDEDGCVIETVQLKDYDLNGFMNSGPSFLWRSDAVRMAGVYDEAMIGIEDRDYATRMAMLGSLYHLPEKLYYYRIHQTSLTSRITNGLYGGWQEVHQKQKDRWLFLQFC